MKSFKPIQISEFAKKDLQKIGKYTLKEWGALQKKYYLGLFKQSFKTLSHTVSGDSIVSFGKSRDEIDSGLLSFIVKKHIVYYRESEQAFIIIRILHSRMDPGKHLHE